MNIIPVALSLHASFMSAIFVLGTPAEIYLNGSMYAYVGLGYCIAAPVTAHVFLPVFYRLNVMSCYEVGILHTIIIIMINIYIAPFFEITQSALLYIYKYTKYDK